MNQENFAVEDQSTDSSAELVEAAKAAKAAGDEYKRLQVEATAAEEALEKLNQQVIDALKKKSQAYNKLHAIIQGS